MRRNKKVFMPARILEILRILTIWNYQMYPLVTQRQIEQNSDKSIPRIVFQAIFADLYMQRIQKPQTFSRQSIIESRRNGTRYKTRTFNAGSLGDQCVFSSEVYSVLLSFQRNVMQSFLTSDDDELLRYGALLHMYYIGY